MAKHFINMRETIVTEALDGLIACSGGRLARLDGYPEIKVVLRADRDPARRGWARTRPSSASASMASRGWRRSPCARSPGSSA